MSELPVSSADAMIQSLASSSLKLEDLTPEQLKTVATWYDMDRHAKELHQRVEIERFDLGAELSAFLGEGVRSPSTIRAYRAALVRLLEWCASRSIHPLGLSPVLADEYARTLKSGPASTSAVRLSIAGASAWYSWIERRHHGFINPFRGTRERPKKDVSKPLVIPLPSEVPIILGELTSAGQYVDAAFLAVLCYRGLRIGGAATLDLRSKDFRTNSKGKDVHGELSEKALAFLKKAELKSGPVFAMRSSEGWRNRVAYLMRDFFSRGLIRAPYSAHDFRHYFAVETYKQNRNIEVLSRFLGHSSLAVTELYLRNLNLD